MTFQEGNKKLLAVEIISKEKIVEMRKKSSKTKKLSQKKYFSRKQNI